MNNLATLQRALQAFVLREQSGAENHVIGTEERPAAARLAIYAEAYRLRLIEALASNYPRLQQAIGADEFDSLAQHYIRLHDSHRPSIRWYGAGMATLLEERAADIWTTELAKWEWAIATAFDAEDAQILPVSALAQIHPVQWPELRLSFHPSMQRLTTTSNAVALFKALTEDRDMPPGQREPPQQWLIWRQQLKTQYRSLEADEAAALDRLREGGTFADACEALCAWHEAEQVPLRAAGYMQRWMHDELVCALF
jgi:hypothetical protein